MKRYFVFAVSAVVLTVSISQAASINWTGGAASNDWNDVASWSTAYVPGATANDATLFVGSSDSTTLVTPFTFTNASTMNLRGGPTVTLNADLSGVSIFYLGGNSGNDGGTVNQLGGILSVVSLKVGSSSGATTDSAYTISGGRILNSGNLSVNKGTFTLAGSSAEVEADSMTVTSIGELKFELGASGVNPISVTNAFSVDASTSKLTVDASAYTATNRVIELVQFGSVSASFAADQISITGLRADRKPASIVFDGDSMNLELAEPNPNWAAVVALGKLTNAPTVYTTNGVVTNVSVGGIQSIMYDGVDYTGSPTRVWAYIGLPAGASTTNPVPAVVLVHGGGGTAFAEWVQKWNERGYAAISMDTEGHITDPDTGVKSMHEWSGPKRTGVYDDMAKPIGDHFMYHATADAILANSLLRSLPEVDADNVGIMGVSWGGVITSTAIGVDDRFAFAAPTYGCGHMYDALNNWGAALGNNEMYKTVWDPVLRMENATMPVLWYSWPKDYHFPMDCQAYTYHPAPGEHMVSLVPGMNHSHGSAWARPESYDFADSIVNDGTGWCVQQSISLTGSDVEVVFAATRPLKTASLIYTTGTGKTGDLDWPETNVTSMVESPAGTWTITAQLPTNATGWFVNTTADANVSGYRGGDVIAGSDYQEVIHVTLTPSSGFEMSHPLTESRSTGSLQVDFTAPTNLEIVDVIATNESHPGSLAYAGVYPFVLYGSGLLGLEFDNTMAGLAAGETATGTVQVVWEHLDGSREQAEIPFTVTARAAETVIYEVSTNWSSKSVYEIDDVMVRGNATVALDQVSAAATLTINDGSLLMNQNYTLTLADSLSVEANGSLSVSDGVLDLNGGTFAVDGLVTIDGGALLCSGLPLSGTGSFVVNSGDVTVGSSTVTSIDLIKISGGTVDFGGGHCQFGKGSSTEFRIVGDTASITMGILNQQSGTGANGTFRFVFNETGISTINATSYMHLPLATIVVDGSAYTGGATNFVLIDSPNFIALGDTNNFSATGFVEQGLNASFVQDQAAGADWVLLVLTEMAYGSWIRGFGLSGTELNMSANPDGDAYSNLEEYIAGLNPNVFDSFAVSNFAAGAGNAFQWSAASGRTYNVYWSSNLVDGFTLVESNAPGGTFSDTNHAGAPAGFYRITVGLE